VTPICLRVDRKVLAFAFAQGPQTRLILNRHSTKYINPSRSSFLSPSSRFASFSESYPSAIPLPDRSPDHVTIPYQPKVDQPSTEQKANTRTRSWNILVIFRDVWRQHKRVKPLGKSPGVRKSIIAIFKSSCEHPPVGILPPSELSVLCLS
jgi:hypothetical protein